ncbi:MAG: nitroreductase [Mycobacterium sp.]|nr:MAG: nitroreductase [Mycobacterium sp.]
MAGNTVNGIPRVDPCARRGVLKRAAQWLAATKGGVAITKSFVVPIDALLLKATGARISVTMGGAPVVVLVSTGARTGLRRETPLQYFTDGDEVILAASNFGGGKHPAWLYNLLGTPECELRAGSGGGRFVAREVENGDRERLFELAIKLYPGYVKYAGRTEGVRTIRMLRLAPIS